MKNLTLILSLTLTVSAQAREWCDESQNAHFWDARTAMMPSIGRSRTRFAWSMARTLSLSTAGT